MEKDYLTTLLRSKNTIFKFKDLTLVWKEENKEKVKKRIHRYIKSGKMNSIRRGIYSKDNDYNKDELATKIYIPSYISLETVLGRSDVIFQYYKSIFVVSYLSREVVIDGQKYIYKKIKDDILNNQSGIKHEDGYSIATPERAFLDILYLHKNYYFDNLLALNWEKIHDILPIYNSKKMNRMVKMFYEEFKKDSQ